MIVLDTHTLVFWVSNPEKLSQKALKIIEQEKKKGGILISTISIWEIYMLIKKGRLKLSMDVDTWVKQLESAPFIRFIPVDNEIAGRSVNLPGFSAKDPADRMIVTTAIINGASLITSDKRILGYRKVNCIW